MGLTWVVASPLVTMNGRNADRRRWRRRCSLGMWPWCKMGDCESAEGRGELVRRRGEDGAGRGRKRAREGQVSEGYEEFVLGEADDDERLEAGMGCGRWRVGGGRGWKGGEEP